MTTHRIIAVIAAVGLACAMQPVRAQSLADVAKKTEEERAAKSKQETKSKSDDAKKPEKPAKVYTNKDLGSAPSAAPADVNADSRVDATPKNAATTITTTTKDLSKDEGYWRGRVEPIRQRIIANLEKEIGIRQRIIDLTRELEGIGPLNARRAGVETERQRLITEADNLDATVRADTRAFENIQEEGRRAGALPGWFRLPSALDK